LPLATKDLRGVCHRDARPRAGADRAGRLRTYALDHPQDPLVAWREHSAAGFEDHPVDWAHRWELANPALGDLLARDGLEACLPPKMREASFRRAGLCQLTDQLEDAWPPPSAWAACEDARGARLAEERRDSPRCIDPAVAAVMAHDRAAATRGTASTSERATTPGAPLIPGS
jgi:hypothetical protein